MPRERRHKLNNKTIEGILIGYGYNVKGYRILDTKTDRVWYSHVKIIEDPVEKQNVKKEPEGEWHPFTEDDDEDDSSPTEIEPPVSPITISDDEDDESIVHDLSSEEDDNDEEPPSNELRRSKRTTAGKPPNVSVI